MNEQSPFAQAHIALQGVNPLVVGFSDSLADSTNDKLTASDLISSAKKGLRPLDRTLDLFQPQPDPAPAPIRQEPTIGPPTATRDELQQQLNDILGKMLKLEPQEPDLSGVIQAQRDVDQPMPLPPALIKPRMTDAERLVTILTGFLGGGATGVAQATDAARNGATQRAQVENADAHRQFERDLAAAKSKMQSKQNRLEVEKLLLSQRDHISKRERDRQLVQLKLDELGVKTQIEKLGERGALRVDGLATLMEDLASDNDGWTVADRDRVNRDIAEIAKEYGLPPAKIRQQLGDFPVSRNTKALESVWYKAGSEFAEFVGRTKLKIETSVAEGKFSQLKQRYVRGFIGLEQVQNEMDAWTSRLSQIAGLISTGKPDDIDIALTAIRSEKKREEFVLQEMIKSGDTAGADAQRAVIEMLLKLESLAGNKKGAVVQKAPKTAPNKGPIGKTPVPGDFGQVKPEDPFGGEYKS